MQMRFHSKLQWGIYPSDHNFFSIDDAAGESLTFTEVVNNIKKFGSYFVKAGVQKNDVIVLFMTNNVYYPVIVHAVMGIGAIASPCNQAYKSGMGPFKYF